jgi:hypothetical protein
MDGELWYEPRFPVGSHFCFTLPLAGDRATVAEHGSPMTEAVG